MEIEIYSNTTNPAKEEFKELLKTEFSKNNNLEEGKVIECTITKLTDQFCYLSSKGLKQEPILPVQELKVLGLLDKIKDGSVKKLSVLLERLEHPKTGEIIVSAEKALKLEGWRRICEMYKNEEPVGGRILRRCKGGAEVFLDELNLTAFLPGSMVSDVPMKNFDSLIGEVQKFAIVKLDMLRGNAVVSRKHIISSFKEEDKKKLIQGFKVGDTVIGTVKSFTSFGVFFRLENSLDCLCHNSQISYSRVTSAEEILSIDEKKELRVIGIDLDKNQLSVSLKEMGPNPFDDIDKYTVGSIYKVKITRLADFGFFATLQENLVVLNHQSEISWSRKNVNVKKLFKVGQEVSVVLKEVNKEEQRVAVSYKMTQENPIHTFEKKFKIGDVVEAQIESKNEYSIFCKVSDIDLLLFCHINNLTWSDDNEEELAKYAVGQKIKVKILDLNTEEQRVRVGLREAIGPDPLTFFEKKNVNDRISCKVISADRRKGLTVRPIGMSGDLDFVIKKSAISEIPADARAERWVGGETVDVCIAEKNLSQRKIVLSIKLLESLDRAEALKKFGSLKSGMHLPFKSLKDDLKVASDIKKKKEEKE